MVSKTGKLVTFRGKISGTVSGTYKPTRILCDDGDPKTAYRILSFAAWAVDGSDFNNDGNMIIATEESGVTDYTAGFTDCSDNRQIGWAAWSNGGAFGDVTLTNGLVDPDNVVNENLYLAGSISSSGGDNINYLITAEKIKINLTENLYTTVRNYSQG